MCLTGVIRWRFILAGVLLIGGASAFCADKMSEDVKNYLPSAQQKAKAWQSDAQLAYLTIGSSVQPDGSNQCSPDRPSTGWNYAFYSKTADAYYTVYACKGQISGEETGKGQSNPPIITQDFIGTSEVVEILKTVGHRWESNHCQSVQALRPADSSFQAESSLAKGKPVWSTMLDCGTVGGAVVIDGITGRILKYRRAS
jgi:hypothetical protein